MEPERLSHTFHIVLSTNGNPLFRIIVFFLKLFWCKLTSSHGKTAIKGTNCDLVNVLKYWQHRWFWWKTRSEHQFRNQDYSWASYGDVRN